MYVCMYVSMYIQPIVTRQAFGRRTSFHLCMYVPRRSRLRLRNYRFFVVHVHRVTCVVLPYHLVARTLAINIIATKRELWGCGPISMFRVLFVQSEKVVSLKILSRTDLKAINFAPFYVVSLCRRRNNGQHARHAGLTLLVSSWD